MTSALCLCCGRPELSCGRKPELDIANPRSSSPLSQSLSSWLANTWVTADFDGVCGICGEPFAPGEEIRALTAGDWQCSTCSD